MVERVGEIVAWAVPILLAVVLHEVAHGWVAYRLGDSTAADRGRLTLNPLAHVDPVGTVLVPLLLVLSNAGFVFGWARPVPVNYANLRSPRRDMMLVAAAGPAANLAIATVAAAVVQTIAAILPEEPGNVVHAWLLTFGLVALYTVKTNVFLALFNLLPIPPLDGGRVLTGLLPRTFARSFARLEPIGFLILIVLMSTDAIAWIVRAPARAIFHVLLR